VLRKKYPLLFSCITLRTRTLSYRKQIARQLRTQYVEA